MMRWMMLAGLLAGSAGLAEAAVRVGVIGDSISTGAHAEPRAVNGYPARMGRLLGEEYEVRAFAMSGHCLLKQSSKPLMGTKPYQAALAYRPDIAVIMLGTNDTNGRLGHWEHRADLEVDLREMIRDLREANPDVMIHLAGPPPMFPQRKGLKPERVKDLTERGARLPEIREVFVKVAAEEPRVVSHDLSRQLVAEQTSDGVHPNTAGHEVLAGFLSEMVGGESDEGFDLEGALKAAGVAANTGDFHGFRKMEFGLPGTDVGCVVVIPEQAAAGRPWIWRARFFGHAPELDLSLLDRGFHVAYCNVKNLYGGPEAMQRWDRFHVFATEQLGLGSQPVLEGMSRGGLPIFRWASRNPEKVAAVYGDHPVCDFRSWPGGTNGGRSDGDWQRLLKAWGIDEAEAADHEQVVDWLEPMAQAKVPVALVLGMADEVVPPGVNGEPVGRRYVELGGPLRVWRKPDAGHHPHGLDPVDELRVFLMEAVD